MWCIENLKRMKMHDRIYITPSEQATHYLTKKWETCLIYGQEKTMFGNIYAKLHDSKTIMERSNSEDLFLAVNQQT